MRRETKGLSQIEDEGGVLIPRYDESVVAIDVTGIDELHIHKSKLSWKFVENIEDDIHEY